LAAQGPGSFALVAAERGWQTRAQLPMKEWAGIRQERSRRIAQAAQVEQRDDGEDG
jgi:hypothetical protein